MVTKYAGKKTSYGTDARAGTPFYQKVDNVIASARKSYGSMKESYFDLVDSTTAAFEKAGRTEDKEKREDILRAAFKSTDSLREQAPKIKGETKKMKTLTDLEGKIGKMKKIEGKIRDLSA